MKRELPPIYTGYNRKLKEKAQELRKNMTKQELHLWYDFLKKRPERWDRQRIIDNFIADFFCYAAGLVVELDGSQHYTEYGEDYDKSRTSVLEQYELEVMRFPNAEVDKNFDGVCAAIAEKVKERMTQFREKDTEKAFPPREGGTPKA